MDGLKYMMALLLIHRMRKSIRVYSIMDRYTKEKYLPQMILE